jgi:hypothetical protein
MPESDDSEVDEFTLDRNAVAGPSRSRREEEDEENEGKAGEYGEEGDEEEVGVARWEPDDLDGHEEEMTEDEDEEDEDLSGRSDEDEDGPSQAELVSPS